VKAAVGLVAALCLPLFACFGAHGGDPDPDAGPPPPPPIDAAPRVDATPIIDGGACDPKVTLFAPVPSPHVAEGSTVTYATNPPSSGPHYPRWARWRQTCASPVLARSYWVHNLEHGGVVFLYRCDAGGCPEVVAGLEQLQAALPRDPRCSEAIQTRTLIAADPELPDGVQVAASAWGATYTATCFDAASLRSFYDARFGRGSEDTCAEGSAP
jgi:hypothetical protein